MRQIEKTETQKKRLPIERIFLIGVGTAVVGYGMYELYKKMSGQDQPTSDPDLLPPPDTTIKTVVVRHDRFPLKKGSLGNNVRLMQLGLQKILGEAELSKFTPIDGDFGSGTERALIQAGFPSKVDEPTFLKIIQGASKSSLGTDPKSLAEQLYRYASTKSIQGVLTVLAEIKNTADYSAVNDFFKQVTEGKTMVTSTIVTYLLNKAFNLNETAKEKIRTEFKRMGLIESSEGKWSLSGIRIRKDIQSLVNTFVSDASGITILVDKGTILGEELSVKSGMTIFKALDGRLYKVPTRDVSLLR